MLEWEGYGMINVFPPQSREPLETSPGKPFRDILDCGDEFFSLGRRILTGTHTDGEGIHEEGPRHQSGTNDIH